MANDDLGKYQGMMPSRAVLARLALFGTDEATRASANAILKALPPMTADERRRYYDETWRLASLPSAEDLLKSPIGRQTLAMLRANQPVAAQKPEAVAPVEPEGPYPEPATPAESIPAKPEQPPDDGINPHLKQLNWPPRPSPKPKDPIDDTPHKWVAGTPSTPSKDQTPVSDWDSFDNNSPIY